MEGLKEIITPAAERAKSKILGTFVIAWIIYNWKFIITLILPSTVNIHNKGLLEFIEQEKILNFCNGFVYPFISSAFFLFIYPHADRWIYKYLEEIRRKKVADKIDIGKQYPVPGKMYWDLKIKLESEREKILEFEVKQNDLVDQTNQLRISEKQLKAELDGIRKTNIEIREIIQFHSERQSTDFLHGRWRLTYTGENEAEEELSINSNNEYEVKTGNNWKTAFLLRIVDINKVDKRVTFVKFKRPNDQERKIKTNPICLYNDLRIIDNNTLEGTENEYIKVTYKRVLFDPKDRPPKEQSHTL